MDLAVSAVDRVAFDTAQIYGMYSAYSGIWIFSYTAPWTNSTAAVSVPCDSRVSFSVVSVRNFFGKKDVIVRHILS